MSLDAPQAPETGGRQISVGGYRQVVAVATLLLALIIFTGAAVRLTGSGLGCEDWPACSEDKLVPEWSFHGWIEFGNRLLSGVVALSVAAAVLLAYRRAPRRRDLIGLAWGLVAGVVAQIILGGITVRVGLSPPFVSAHFLLSAILMANAMVLWAWAKCDNPPRPLVPRSIRRHGELSVGLAALALVVGTLVTGTGPHGGDGRADRLSFDLENIARLHSAMAWIFLASVVALAVRLRRTPDADSAGLRRPLTITLASTTCQGAIGYWQFAVGIPPLLVELHVIGAIATWCAVLNLRLCMVRRSKLQTPIDSGKINS